MRPWLRPVHNRRWKVARTWSLFVGLAAIVALAISGAWLDGSELFFLGLAALSAGVFVAAYLISSRQIEAAVREEAIAAKNEIVALKAKVAELKKALKTAAEERSKQVLILTAKIDALEEVIKGGLAPSNPKAKAFSDTAEDDAIKIEAANDAADKAEADVGDHATDLEKGLEGVLPSVTELASQLPEKHRLAGVWVAAGVALAVLAFLSVANIDITTSTTSTGDAQEEASGLADEQDRGHSAQWCRGRPGHPHC
jgi:uncharacterized iron-regulated membrane protein